MTQHLSDTREGVRPSGREPTKPTPQPGAPKAMSEKTLEGKLEPEARDGCDSVSEAALLSLAVSAKRIADLLCGNPKNSGLIDMLDAIARRP